MDLIIGAGITGLSYAMFTKQSNYLILEKDNEIGGYCRTTKRNGFVWDYSGHFFHFQNKDIRDLILEGINRDEMVEVVKETRIKYKDLLVDYPFQKNIHQLSKEELIDCLYDLFTASDKDYTDFEEMLYCRFGKSIAEKFLIPYNEKLYACSLNTLDKDAMGRFFPFADKEDIIRNFRKTDNSSYNGSFVYPQGGAVEYVKSVARNVDQQNIRCSAEVEELDLEKHEAILKDGSQVKYNRLISTLPFPILLDKAHIDYDKSVYTWNQVLCFNLGFDKKGADINDHWLYFPEKKYCFYRVGFYDNILGQDRMSLYVELGFGKDVAVRPDDWIDKVLEGLKEAGIVSEAQSLVDSQSILMNPAYVHINSRSVDDVVEKKSILEGYDVYSIGRYGSWTYCSIEDNIKEAEQLAEKLCRTTE